MKRGGSGGGVLYYHLPLLVVVQPIHYNFYKDCYLEYVSMLSIFWLIGGRAWMET